MCHWNLCLTFQKGLEVEAYLEGLEAVGLEGLEAAAILEADYLEGLEAGCGDRPGGGVHMAAVGLEAAWVVSLSSEYTRGAGLSPNGN